MDFIIGVLFVIIVILVIYNFASINISDSPGAGVCSNDRNTIAMPPKPVSARPNTAMNGKINLDAQTYDYSKYFYV